MQKLNYLAFRVELAQRLRQLVNVYENFDKFSSDNEFAAACGLTAATFSRVLSGACTPSLETLVSIACVLACSESVRSVATSEKAQHGLRFVYELCSVLYYVKESSLLKDSSKFE